MRFRDLGALLVDESGVERPAGSGRIGSVLAMLVAHAGAVVSVDALVDGVWGENAPVRAAQSLETVVWRLRTFVEPDRSAREAATLIRREALGYRLAVPDESVDSRVFEHAARQVRQHLDTGRPGPALELTEGTLALWRGLPYDGVAGGEWLAPVFHETVGHNITTHASKSLEYGLMVPGILACFIGLGIAYQWYVKDEEKTPARLAADWPRLHRAVYNKWYVDELYDATIIGGTDALADGAALMDTWIVDGILAKLTSLLVSAFGSILRAFQTGVVHVYAHGEDDGRLYIATQLVPDGDLGAMLQSYGAPPVKVALDLIAQVAAGLSDAHAAGMIHRDIKPANILLRRRGNQMQAYLGDFGIARNLAAENPDLERANTIGTPSYMAPELHSGSDAGVATDIYS